MPQSNALSEAILDVESRSIRTTKLDVIEMKSSDGSALGLGMMIAVIANKESNMLPRLRTLLNGSQEEAKEAYNILNKKPTHEGPATIEEFVKTLVSQPVYAEIRYGGESLQKGLFVPSGMDAISTIFPYNGGRLASEGFTLVERSREGSSAGLDAFILRSAPELTAAESAALRDVAPDQLVSSVGPASWCETTWWGVAVATLAVTFTAATAALATLGVINRQGVISRQGVINRGTFDMKGNLTEKEIEKLGPDASARSLLALRRKLILTNVPKLVE